MDVNNPNLDSFQSNATKIKTLELEIERFVLIFSEQGGIQNETILDETRLKNMEQYERFGLQLFRKDHLMQYLNYLKGL